jgi:predicted phosphodiesterase
VADIAITIGDRRKLAVKLIVTSDLHYNIARSIEPTRTLAEEICSLRADGLLLLGDTAGRDLGIVSECLHLFDRFDGRKFFVAGNHDIWTHPGGDSLKKLEIDVPAVCDEAGFHPLDLEPARLDGTGLVGSIGWYDYSYRPRWLDIPLRFYEHKIAPGAAARFHRYRHLLDETDDVPDAAMQISSRWMDGEYVRLDMSDADFCDRLLERLNTHLDTMASRCDRIVVGTHHLPSRAIFHESCDPQWAFATAFLGSEAFGRAIHACPKVKFAFSGHSHRGMCARRDHVTFVNVGSTYAHKLHDLIDL